MAKLAIAKGWVDEVWEQRAEARDIVTKKLSRDQFDEAHWQLGIRDERIRKLDAIMEDLYGSPNGDSGARRTPSCALMFRIIVHDVNSTHRPWPQRARHETILGETTIAQRIVRRTKEYGCEEDVPTTRS
jgi:hypothetical protein